MRGAQRCPATDADPRRPCARPSAQAAAARAARGPRAHRAATRRACATRSPARRRASRAARRRQGPPRHQAVERAGHARRAAWCCSTSAWSPTLAPTRPRRPRTRSLGTVAYMAPEQALTGQLGPGRRLVQRRRDALRGADRARCRSTAGRARGPARQAAAEPPPPRELGRRRAARPRRSCAASSCAAIPGSGRGGARCCAGWARRRAAASPAPPVVGAAVASDARSSAASRELEALRDALAPRRSGGTRGPCCVARRVGHRQERAGARFLDARRARARRRVVAAPAAATSASRCRTRRSTAWSTR